MLEFFTILFFSKTILLTPDYVDIDPGSGGHVIELDEPISAITAGASIQIDVSSMLAGSGERDLMQMRRAIADTFPAGAIEVTITGETDTVRLAYEGHTSIDNDSARLLVSSNEIPTGVDFDRVSIKTGMTLTQVKIYWKNYKH